VPQFANALEDLAVSAAPSVLQASDVAGVSAIGLPSVVGEGPVLARPPHAATVLGALSAPSPTVAAADLRSADHLDLRPFPDAVANIASLSVSRTVGALEGLDALPTAAALDFEIPGLVGARAFASRPMKDTGKASLPVAPARSGPYARRSAAVVLEVPAQLSIAPLPDLASDGALPVDPLTVRALSELEACAAPLAMPELPVFGPVAVEPFRPARQVVMGAGSRRAPGLDLVTLPARALSATEPISKRALGGTPELLSVAGGAGEGVPADAPAVALETAITRRLAGAYYGLGRFFDEADDVETGALMYREAVALGPDGARHFRLACRALARAYRKMRDWPGLAWLASTLEALPDSESWARELAGRIRR